MRRFLLVCALLCAASSCTAVTQTTVVIEADDMVNAAHPQVRVQVFRANDVNGALDIEERNQLVPTDLGYPIRVAIIPRGGDTGRRYDVRVTAMSGPLTWSTRAISGFVPGQRRELRMRLEDACRTRLCPSDQTCRADMCVPIEVDPSMLVTPGATDTGMRVDAALPPGTDAPMPVETDAGPMERCPWQVETVMAAVEVPFQPLVAVDGGSVFIAYTSDVGSLRGVYMVHRPVRGSGWSSPVDLVPAMSPGERSFSFRVDSSTWRVATTDGSTKRIRTELAAAQTLPAGVSANMVPQMGLSEGSPRFFFPDGTGLAIWTPSEPRRVIPTAMNGAAVYAPNGADDSVVSNGMLYRYRGGSWMAPQPVDSSVATTYALLSEPDGTLHIVYTDGTNAMHRSVPPGGVLGVATRIAPRGSDQALSAAGPSTFYWSGHLWNRDGSMREELPLPSGWLPNLIGTGGLVIDGDGGLHLVAQVTSTTGVRYAYRPPCL